MLLKSIVSVLVLTAAVHASAFNLNSQQENSILDHLNTICGDTWCEGEYNLNFTSVQYLRGPKSSYLIHFIAENSYDANPKKFFHSCLIEDSSLLQKILVNPADNEAEFYEVMDTCVSTELLKHPNQ